MRSPRISPLRLQSWPVVTHTMSEAVARHAGNLVVRTGPTDPSELERFAAASRNRMPTPICRQSINLAKSGNCPSAHWLEAAAPHLASPRMRMLNVGANKGYAVNHFFLRFLPGWNVTNDQWLSAVQEGHAAAPCGICKACEENVSSVWAAATSGQHRLRDAGPLLPAMTSGAARGQYEIKKQHSREGAAAWWTQAWWRQRAERLAAARLQAPAAVDVRAVAVEMMGENAKLLKGLFERFAMPVEVIHAAAAGHSSRKGAFVPQNFGTGRESAVLSFNPEELFRVRMRAQPVSALCPPSRPDLAPTDVSRMPAGPNGHGRRSRRQASG